jgi:CheY-like chemotaxis protein/DNA-binding XRE family transcriptional regulator
MKHDDKTIDTHIGQKIRERRVQLRLSQAELGAALDVSAQQVQRYETGENGLGLNRLSTLATILNVQPSFFTDELPTTPSDPSGIVGRGLGRALRILVVEDDPNDILLFQKAVDRLAQPPALHALQRAEDVFHYLNKPGSHGYPDIVMLDINMPRVTGIDLLRQIKSSAHKKLPVVIFTNSVRTKDMLACYEAQANSFVQKSADLRQFYEDVERIVLYWSSMAILPGAA